MVQICYENTLIYNPHSQFINIGFQAKFGVELLI